MVSPAIPVCTGLSSAGNASIWIGVEQNGHSMKSPVLIAPSGSGKWHLEHVIAGGVIFDYRTRITRVLAM